MENDINISNLNQKNCESDGEICPSILEIIKAHYNIVKTRPPNVNWLTVGISMQLQWNPIMYDQYTGVIMANL